MSASSNLSNWQIAANGLVAALCDTCGKRSRFHAADRDGEPDIWQLGRGWSIAPFPHDFRHDNGSVGSTYTCPACNALLKQGHILTTRFGQREMRVMA